MSGSIRLRVRGPQGLATLTFAATATWEDLKREISNKTGVPDFDLKYGYPPQNFNTESIDSQVRLSDLPYKLNGEQLTVVPRSMQDQLSSPLAGTTARNTAAANALPPQPSTASSSEHPSRPLNLTRKANPSLETDPPEIPLPALEGVMVLRVMPDDNSCMFRALSSAVLGSSLDAMTELRSIVAQTISSNPETYSEAILEKPPADYCRWISNPDSWGGGIELAILSQHFDVEICSINVQDLRIDRFHERRPTRVILVYSGIHYDVVAVTPYSGADPEFDRKVFDVLRTPDDDAAAAASEEEDGGALQAALELCRGLQKQHYFTDTAGFALKCQQCGEGGNGQQWAVQHARATGHGDFGEG